MCRYIFISMYIGLATLWFLVMAIAQYAMPEPEKLRCVNNAIQIRQSDGPSLCVVQGIYYSKINLFINMYIYIYIC
jgi:hypothetical protein